MISCMKATTAMYLPIDHANITATKPLTNELIKANMKEFLLTPITVNTNIPTNTTNESGPTISQKIGSLEFTNLTSFFYNNMIF